MKVLAINGSPHAQGNTYIAIKAITDVLNAEGIDTEIVTVGGLGVTGCKGCGACGSTGKCIIDDGMNEIFAKMREADGLIIGTPVYYSGINGTLKSFLDRAFYTSSKYMRFKPCAAVCALRRSGATLALQTIHQYFALAEMLVTPSIYWNAVHGAGQGEAMRDKEGMQIMQTIGRNMSYLLKMQSGCQLPLPEKPDKIKYNYVR